MSANVTATMNGTQVTSYLNPVTEGKRIGFNFAYSFYKIRKIQNKERKKVNKRVRKGVFTMRKIIWICSSWKTRSNSVKEVGLKKVNESYLSVISFVCLLRIWVVL